MSISRYSSRQHLIPCNKGGAHSGEYAQYICVKKECLELDPVLCEVCRAKGHKNHRVIPIRDFFTQVTHRVNRQRIKDYTNIQAVVEESEQVCRQSFNNLKEYVLQKLRIFDTLLTDCYATWKDNVALFEEHHCLEVISDIQQMQRETDITLFSSQVKKILPFIKFDVSDDGLAKPSSTPYQTANTSIKSITNDILGLPPLSRQEVHGFQQAFLTSLKKISENIHQQLSSVSFGRQKGSTSSVLNVTQQQSRRQEESFISQLDANATFLESATPVNNSRIRSQQPNQLIPDISPVNQMNIIENSSKFIPQSNNSNLQYYQITNQGPSNQNGQLNKSYLTPRGTYRAQELLSFVKNSDSVSKISQHKRNNSAAQFSNQKQMQNGILGNLNSTLQEHNPTGIQVIDNVQKQVDDIQKSLDNLRQSFDFQKILQFVDEKSPNRNLKNSIDPQPGNNIGVKQPSKYNNQNNQQANFFSNPNQQTPQSAQLAQSVERSQMVSGNTLLGFTNTPQTQGFTQAASELSQVKRNLNNLSQHQSIMNQSTFQSQQQSKVLQQPLSFSEKFQRFREMSKSQSRDNSLNNSYQRFRYDSQMQKQQQEEELSEENRKKSLNSKKVKFYFSQDLKHEFVNVSKYIAQGQKDNYSTRLVLLEPTVEIVPHREITFSFLIKSCKNMEYGHPLAIGLCHKNIVHQNNFEFPQKEETFTGLGDKQKDTISTAASSVASYHGCYLLTSSGFLRNHSYPKQDMKKVPVRFNAKDVIICHFNPFRKTLKFTKQSSGESCILNVDTVPNDKLYPCVRISYAQDCVEYIHE